MLAPAGLALGGQRSRRCLQLVKDAPQLAHAGLRPAMTLSPARQRALGALAVCQLGVQTPVELDRAT